MVSTVTDEVADELRTLCRDRALLTPEIHAANDFYGNAAALKAYAGLAESSSLKATVEHSIPLWTEFWAGDLDAKLPVFLCAAVPRAEAFTGATGRPAFAIGPMLEYAQPLRPRRAGRRLLVFPAHSTHHIDADYDPGHLAGWTDAVREEFEAVTVCMYWREVQRNMHAPYVRAGFECVSAGHMFDPWFLRRLRTFLDEADAVATNEIGSHLLYAAGRNLPVALLDQHIEYRYESEEVARRDGVAADQIEPHRRLRSVFGSELGRLEEPVLSLVAETIGRDQLKSPSELRSILEQAADRYLDATGNLSRTRNRIAPRARNARQRWRHRREKALGAA